MKPVGLISAGVLLLILGAAAPTYARQDQHEGDSKAPKQEEAKPVKQQEEAKPAKQEEAKVAPRQEEQAKPEKQQEETKPVKQQEEAKPAKQEEAKAAPRQEEQAKPEKQQEAKAAPKHEQEAKPVRQQQVKAAPKQEQQAKVQQEQAKTDRQPQRSAAAEQKQHAEPALRLSVRGDGRIPDDRFRASFGSGHTFRIGSPTLVGGYSRFQYGGFWFGFVQPWPVGWYYSDDVYVDYIDGGYYLCNPYYPDSRISISVVI